MVRLFVEEELSAHAIAKRLGRAKTTVARVIREELPEDENPFDASKVEAAVAEHRRRARYRKAQLEESLLTEHEVFKTLAKQAATAGEVDERRLARDFAMASLAFLDKSLKIEAQATAAEQAQAARREGQTTDFKNYVEHLNSGGDDE